MRSKFEQRVKEMFPDSNYESEKLEYTVIETHVYIPDFIIYTDSGKKIYLECKGYFDLDDRKKMLNVIEQYPSLDIRMVFQNPNIRISNRSKTKVSEWCDKHNIKWGTIKTIEQWLHDSDN